MWTAPLAAPQGDLGTRAGEIDGVDIHVIGQPRDEFGGRAGEDVDHPGGTSELSKTSEKVMAGSGWLSEAMTTAVLPVTMTGASRETSPSRAGCLRRDHPDDPGWFRG